MSSTVMPLKVELINRDTIKPTSPTPDHLKHFKVSLLDQLAAAAYVPIILFYPKQQLVVDDDDDESSVKSIDRFNHRLKSSLSETLTRFYPLAGRANGNTSIDCNDEGAEFIESRVNCLLSDFLKQPNFESSKLLLPNQIKSSADNSTGRFLLLVQSSLFECGGIAIGVNISHMLGDAASISTFIKSWSATALRGSHPNHHDQYQVVPHFVGDSLLPPSPHIPVAMQSPDEVAPQVKCLTRRFVFDAQKIAALKEKAASESVQKPTRVEAIFVLIWKCATAASKSSASAHGVVKQTSVLSVTVNFRSRISPPLPQTSIGNLLGSFIAQSSTEDMKLEALVGKLREGMTEFSKNGVKIYQEENAFPKIMEALGASFYQRQDVDFYTCSSWSRLDLYDTDFGWGKPMWVTVAGLMFLNFIMLMDTKDGQGIEAWVTLSEPHMAFFEADPELLSFASPNPRVF